MGSGLIVIPARYGATRLPGKPLLAETGRALVLHVWEQACAARRADRVIVATDHPGVAEAVRAAGGEAELTRAEHASGTDRVAEVARRHEHPIVVNLQGDEPEMDPALLDRIIEALEEPGSVDLVTAAAPAPEAALGAPHVVKVVLDGLGRALYFSRAGIPFFRDRTGPAQPLQHLGVYGFRREALLRFAALPPSPLERAEGLEQLRALEARMVVRVLLTDRAVPGIDTREDYDAFIGRFRRMARMGSSGR